MRYQKIYTQIWNDEKFVELSPAEQRFFLYLLTAPSSNLIGIYVLKEGYACDDLKCLQKDFQRLLSEVLQKGLVSYDEKHKVILIKKYLKHNPLTNPNQVKAAVKIVSSLPKSHLLQEFKGILKSIIEGLQEGLMKGHLEAFLYSAPVTASVKETDPGEKDEIPYKEIIEDLNQKSGKNYKHTTKDVQALIIARMSEGFTFEDFQKVHDNMTAKWKGDPKMDRFLRPATLYQASKFQGYLNERVSLSEQGKISTLSEKNLKAFENFKGD